MGWTGFRPLTLVLIMILSLAGWLQHCDFAVRYLWESIEFCSVGFFKDQGREAWPLDESKFVSHCRDSAHGSRWQEALRVALVTHVMKSCQTSNPFPHVPHEVVKSVLLRLQFITMADFKVKYPKLFVSCIVMFNASPITLNMQLNWAVFKTLHRFDGTGWFIDPSKQTTYIYIYLKAASMHHWLPSSLLVSGIFHGSGWSRKRGRLVESRGDSSLAVLNW